LSSKFLFGPSTQINSIMSAQQVTFSFFFKFQVNHHSKTSVMFSCDVSVLWCSFVVPFSTIFRR
jgi:hypothetical protein